MATHSSSMLVSPQSVADRQREELAYQQQQQQAQQEECAAERKRRLYLQRIATAKSLIQLGSRPNANLDHAESLLRDAAHMLEGWIDACYYDEIISDDDDLGYESMDDDDDDMASAIDDDDDELSALFDDNDQDRKASSAAAFAATSTTDAATNNGNNNNTQFEEDNDDLADDISFDDMSTISGCRESLMRQQRLQEQQRYLDQPQNLPIPSLIQTAAGSFDDQEFGQNHPEDDLDAPFIVLLAQSRHRLGQIALQRGQLVHASQLLLQVVLHDPQTLSPSALAMTWYDIALVYLHFNKCEQASVALKQAHATIVGHAASSSSSSEGSTTRSGNLLLMFVQRAMRRLREIEASSPVPGEPLPWSRQFTVVTYNYDGSDSGGNGQFTSHHPQYQQHQQEQQPSLVSMNVSWWELTAPPAAGAA